MDIDFGEENQGCQFELGLLLDESTDRELLIKLLIELWQTLPSDNINRKLAQPCLQLFPTSGALHSVEALMNLLAVATENQQE